MGNDKEMKQLRQMNRTPKANIRDNKTKKIQKKGLGKKREVINHEEQRNTNDNP